MTKRLARVTLSAALTAVTTACASGAPQPVRFDAANEPCRFCRMVGSDGRTAAELVGRNAEPLFFDDIGCLRGFLMRTDAAADGVAYVVDHRTGEWIRAEQAQYTRNDAVATPMGSHLLAHASAASRDADPDARGGAVVPFAEVFAGVRVPGGMK